MPYVRLGIAQIAIGAAAIFARYALAGAGPLAVSALRLTIATIALAAIARGLEKLSFRRELAFAAAGLALALHFATWIASLAYTSVAISTLLVTTTPLWTELFDSVRNKRAPSKTFSLALALGFVGVALVASQHGGNPPRRGHELLGDALALAGSIAIGAYLLIVRDTAVDAAGARLATRQLVVRTYGWAAIVLLLASAVAHQAPPPLSNGIAWGAIGAMALISQLLGHTALNASLATFSPSVVALSTLCEPVVAAVFAALLFAEPVGPLTLLGGIFVLLSVAIVLRATKDVG
jgi:drug/metabolite transporter (DMT)-like permease